MADFDALSPADASLPRAATNMLISALIAPTPCSFLIMYTREFAKSLSPEAVLLALSPTDASLATADTNLVMLLSTPLMLLKPVIMLDIFSRNEESNLLMSTEASRLIALTKALIPVSLKLIVPTLGIAKSFSC